MFQPRPLGPNSLRFGYGCPPFPLRQRPRLTTTARMAQGGEPGSKPGGQGGRLAGKLEREQCHVSDNADSYPIRSFSFDANHPGNDSPADHTAEEWIRIGSRPRLGTSKTTNTQWRRGIFPTSAAVLPMPGTERSPGKAIASVSSSFSLFFFSFSFLSGTPVLCLFVQCIFSRVLKQQPWLCFMLVLLYSGALA